MTNRVQLNIQNYHSKFFIKPTMTKWLVQKQNHRTTQKQAEQQDATDIQKETKETNILFFTNVSIFLFFKIPYMIFSKKC